ncbi:hypothetical protein ABPG72_003280 [Tetrahymena utriculariae]
MENVSMIIMKKLKNFRKNFLNNTLVLFFLITKIEITQGNSKTLKTFKIQGLPLILVTLILYSQIAAQFVTKLIKVKLLLGNNIYGSNLRYIDISVPSKDQKTGVENSDLNLYIIYFNSGSSALANTASCFINPVNQRSTFGRISFNIGYLTNIKPNYFKFQLDLQVLLHEIINVLGFSSDSMQYWIDPETQKLKNYQKFKNQYILNHKRIQNSDPNLEKSS